MASKFFRAAGPVSATFWTPPRPIRRLARSGFEGVQRFAGVCFAEEERGVHVGGAIRIERILNLARVLSPGNEMSLSFTIDRGAHRMSTGELRDLGAQKNSVTVTVHFLCVAPASAASRLR